MMCDECKAVLVKEQETRIVHVGIDVIAAQVTKCPECGLIVLVQQKESNE